MIDRTFRILLFTLAILAAPAFAQEAATKDPLAMFDPLVGKTWRGEGTAGEVAGKTDMITWKRIMGGKAVQWTHSIDEGTTAKFHSTGTVQQADNGDIIAVEHIHGIENLPEVRGRIVFTERGWETRASYLKDGEWVEGDGFRYVEAPLGKVVFRDVRQIAAPDTAL